MSIRWVLLPLELLAQVRWCLFLGAPSGLQPLGDHYPCCHTFKDVRGLSAKVGGGERGGHSLPLLRAPPSRPQLSEATAGHLEVGSWLFPTAAKVFCLRAPGCHPAQAEPVRGGTRSFTVTFTFVQRRGTNCPPRWKVARCTGDRLVHEGGSWGPWVLLSPLPSSETASVYADSGIIRRAQRDLPTARLFAAALIHVNGFVPLGSQPQQVSPAHHCGRWGPITLCWGWGASRALLVLSSVSGLYPPAPSGDRQKCLQILSMSPGRQSGPRWRTTRVGGTVSEAEASLCHRCQASGSVWLGRQRSDVIIRMGLGEIPP